MHFNPLSSLLFLITEDPSLTLVLWAEFSGLAAGTQLFFTSSLLSYLEYFILQETQTFSFQVMWCMYNQLHGTTTLSEMCCCFSRVSALASEAELPLKLELGKPALGISISSRLSHCSSILHLCSDHAAALSTNSFLWLFHLIYTRKKDE